MQQTDSSAGQLSGSFGFRWLHILAGITWIGLLYYFNFVQVPAFADVRRRGAGPQHRHRQGGPQGAVVVPLGGLSTFVTGILITIVTEDYFANEFGKQAGGIAISTGMLLGTIMMLNVWGVIWRNQKVVLANAANVVAGGEADPAAAAAGRKALMASRQNTVFSVTMLFFMVFSAHSPASAAILSSGKMRRLLGHHAHHHRRAGAQRPRPAAVEDAAQQGPQRDVRRAGRAQRARSARSACGWSS